jgi:hypothetical protein
MEVWLGGCSGIEGRWVAAATNPKQVAARCVRGEQIQDEQVVGRGAMEEEHETGRSVVAAGVGGRWLPDWDST